MEGRALYQYTLTKSDESIDPLEKVIFKESKIKFKKGN